MMIPAYVFSYYLIYKMVIYLGKVYFDVIYCWLENAGFFLFLWNKLCQYINEKYNNEADFYYVLLHSSAVHICTLWYTTAADKLHEIN